MKIVTDSSVMYSIEQAAELGFEVMPLSVTINGETWLEYEEISSPEFLEKVRAGATPTSSCPPVGFMAKAFDTEEDVICLSMADGLSGSYSVAHAQAEQTEPAGRVHVINTRTLCVPHRIMALAAIQMRERGLDTKTIVENMEAMANTHHSYLIPEDFDFLRRGGRLTPMAAKFASLLKAVPVMKQTEDGRRLERLAITRSLNKGIAAIIEEMKSLGVGEGHYISVSHADNPSAAKLAIKQLEEAFPGARFGVFDLSPAFITQGGPGCFAIQSIDMALCPEIDPA
ncbi:MAG: DegV family protein [Eggerthellaceae bacterium]|nr:DegV family protein [Eggerthellaceae bacterium]